MGCLFVAEKNIDWDLEYNTANIILFLASQIAEILYVSDRKKYTLYDVVLGFLSLTLNIFHTFV